MTPPCAVTPLVWPTTEQLFKLLKYSAMLDPQLLLITQLLKVLCFVRGHRGVEGKRDAVHLRRHGTMRAE